MGMPMRNWWIRFLLFFTVIVGQTFTVCWPIPDGIYIDERDLHNTRGLYGRPLFFWLFLLASLKYRAKSIQSIFFLNSVVHIERESFWFLAVRSHTTNRNCVYFGIP
jgi:hypothetical protein